jgi:hypothetical protein
MLNHRTHTRIRAIQIATSNINPHNRHRAQPSLPSRSKSANCAGKTISDRSPSHSSCPRLIESVMCVVVESSSPHLSTIYLAKMNSSWAGRLNTFMPVLALAVWRAAKITVVSEMQRHRFALNPDVMARCHGLRL